MNDTGKKFDQGKPEWDLLPTGPLEEVVKVLMHGKEKYGRDNWQLIDNPIRRYYSAAQRHLSAFRLARFDSKNPFDAIDSESKLHHLAHAACCILFMLWHERKELCQEDAAEALLDRVLEELTAPQTKPVIAKPTLTYSFEDDIRFVTYDQQAPSKLTARDTSKIRRKVLRAVGKGDHTFEFKGIRFWRVK